MSIKQRLVDDVKSAMKAREQLRLDCLRMLRAKILEREVALRGEKGRGYELTDEEAIAVIAAYGKQRRDSIDSYRAAGRDELAAKEQAELEILSAYLPRQLSEDELRSMIREAIAEAGASSAREIGAVMKLLMPRVQGAADGKLVNRMVRELLG